MGAYLQVSVDFHRCHFEIRKHNGYANDLSVRIERGKCHRSFQRGLRGSKLLCNHLGSVLFGVDRRKPNRVRRGVPRYRQQPKAGSSQVCPAVIGVEVNGSPEGGADQKVVGILIDLGLCIFL